MGEQSAEFLGKTPGPIGGAGVDDKDVAGPTLQRREAVGKIQLLVEGDDDDVHSTGCVCTLSAGRSPQNRSGLTRPALVLYAVAAEVWSRVHRIR